MRNQLCDRFGIEFPIFGFTHCRDVAAALSNAGGFGVLGMLTAQPEELDWIDEHVGPSTPYGLDALIPAKRADVNTRTSLRDQLPDEHRRFVEELLDKYGVPPMPDDTVTNGVAQRLAAENRTTASGLIELATQHPRVRLVASALGPPPPEMVEVAHEHDVLVAALVGNRQHAERQVAAGVDIIVAQGYEAGGHTGEIGTMVLVPEIVDTVAPLPVLAAGGIANGRQLAAALALGAQGVWCGSVWLTTVEAETHPVVKQKFLAAGSSDTVRSRALTGKPARQLRSAWTDEWDDPRNPDPLPMPLQSALVADAQRRIARSAHVPGSGAEALANYFVGQVVGSLNRERTVRQVVFEMVDEYVSVVEKLGATP